MNAELKEDGTLALEIRREFLFPRELVFEAWLNKEHLAQWMGPTPDINLVHTEVDAQQGGSYRLGLQEKGCSDSASYVHGEYLEIKHPEKLVFTWIGKILFLRQALKHLSLWNFLKQNPVRKFY